MPIFLIPLLCLAFWCVYPQTAGAADSAENRAAVAAPSDWQSTERPKVGLVLSGGGAKGLAHVGVLRVLEEIRVPVDYIAGTSAGSAVAAMYALGMPVDEIEQRFIDMNWLSSFRDNPGRIYRPVRRTREDWRYPVVPGIGVSADGVHLGQGLISGQNLGFILNELTRDAALVRDFDQLAIPFRAVATDLETGEEVVLREGSLADAVRASMSIPGVYAPLTLDGRVLVDGGVANNIPISVVQDMGADVVIAVDITDPLASGDRLREAFSVVGQLTTMLTRENAVEQLARLGEKDVLIRPDLEGVTSADFYQAARIFEIGATAARQKASALHDLTVEPEQWQAYQTRRAERPFRPGPVVAIEINPESRLSEEFLRSRLHQQLGQPLDVAQLELDLKHLYGLGYHETISYNLRPVEGGAALELRAREKSWGPNYLSFGLGFEDNFRDYTNFNVAASLRMTELNRLGGEWQTGLQLGTEPYLRSAWFQPLGFGSNQFVEAAVEYEKERFNLFDPSGERFADADISHRQLELSLGTALSINTEARLGLTRGYASPGEFLRYLAELDNHVHQGGLELGLVHDSLDDPLLPSRGMFFGVRGHLERPGLGSERNNDRLSLMVSGAMPWRQYRLLGSLYLDSVVRGQAGLEDVVLLGGFRRLSGYGYGEVNGPDAALASVSGYREFGGPFVPFYAGLGFETGNAWERLRDARGNDLRHSWSAFAGIDTFLGPVQVTGAYNDENRWSVYLNIGYYLGRLFEQ
ncbi:patatin-like phospholipase family protein [Marinobacter sp. CA1]|uniref:patatin-like phospholipase family protein n=1 Tax=Marinobacter sp. CA1 TaxID=2817656 RepID=UPI001D08227E|nr:patatin-like phospholipase family protein [Marinobacter sp. CA1]